MLITIEIDETKIESNDLKILLHDCLLRQANTNNAEAKMFYKKLEKCASDLLLLNATPIHEITAIYDENRRIQSVVQMVINSFKGGKMG